MKILVQKFGGTSLATEENRECAIKKILEAKNNYDGVVVVVSAMGRSPQPYATDTLLNLIGPKDTKISPREMDLLMSCGEIISTVVLSNMLLKEGVKPYSMTGGTAGIITNNNHLNAEIIDVDTSNLMTVLKEGFIPIVAGFQGRGTNNEVTTIGRGGSDTSAVLLGEALGAESVEIYTDVDGIMTADPRICKTANLIDEISYSEVFQMADSGAKVIHPRAVEIARRAGMPLIIKNTFNNLNGTNITEYNKLDKKSSTKEKLITSIAHRVGRAQFLVEGDIDDEKFFGELADKNVSIDIINIFPKRRVFTIEEEKKKVVLEVLKGYTATYSFIENCCKVTVIGEKMTGVPGVMAKIIKCLSEIGVEILQTADSLSTIACLVKKEDLEKSVEALHKVFELD
ncbi:MAG: aspartate kinase [Firmicutes bacterium HGW-Firmicutes-1]|jgi:aspartate kinase|nr:MAG: aspartate kinase [Firmicutes bacterium HGW-Firmicutes-1]